MLQPEVLVRGAADRERRRLRPQPHQQRHPAPVPRAVAADHVGVGHGRLRQAVWRARRQPRDHGALLPDADPRADQGRRRLRPFSLMEILALSLEWEPDLHGSLVLILAVALLPGTVYLL